MIKDALGNEISPGDKVVYNLSGELAVGEIISAEITHSEKTTYSPYHRETYRIKIRIIRRSDNWLISNPIGHISTVRNPKGIIRVASIV